jgi:DNA-directed RNA polymerase specialized sigma24 family protein
MCRERSVPTVPRVDLRTAVRSLPEPYRRALRAIADGADEAELGAQMGIPVASVHPFVQLALAKLATLLDSEDRSAPEP